MKPWLGITWGISNRFGWGVYGLNLVLELVERGSPIPVCFGDITTEGLSAEALQKIQPVIDFREQNLSNFYRMNQVARLKDATVLHALGNGMNWNLVSQAVEGDQNVGVIFFEYTTVTDDARARANKLNAVFAGSSWNTEVLTERGVNNVTTVLQGIDTELFRPQPRTEQFGDKFVVFSGGKIDFRKGQDIAVKAMAAFMQRHDDVLLATAWHNLWPLTALQMYYSPHTTTLPDIRPDGLMDVTKWAAEQGIPPDRFIDIGMVPNHAMPGLLRDMDVALFPNRCEGGTNLVAMETMACGVPCILSDNTGHKDLIDGDNCFVLETQDTVTMPGFETDGWGESSVDEIVEQLEAAYQDRDRREAVGQAGADFMVPWSWKNKIATLLEELDKVDGAD